MELYNNDRVTPPEGAIDLDSAVQHFLESGGVINVVAEGKSGNKHQFETPHPDTLEDIQSSRAKKADHLKELVAKGAGISALQYSLRMNKREVRRMAADYGVHIPYSRPLEGVRTQRNQKRSRSESALNDELAGMAAHLYALGCSTMEIAQQLDLSLRQVWSLTHDAPHETITALDRD